MTGKRTGIPIGDILNANPEGSFVRHDLSARGLLQASIAEEGLLFPLVLDANYQVIDGARRLWALHAMGWDHVPAIATNDWVTLRDTLVEQRHQEALRHIEAKPLTWSETSDIYLRILKPLTEKISNERRTLGRWHGQQGAVAGRPSLVMEEVGAMLGVTANHVRGCSDVIRRLARIESELGPEEHAKWVHNIYQSEFGDPNDRVLAISAATRLGKILRPERPDAPKRPSLEPTVAIDVQLQTIQRAVDLLKTIAPVLEDLGPLHTTMDPEVARRLAIAVQGPTTQLGRIRRELFAIGERKVHVPR